MQWAGEMRRPLRVGTAMTAVQDICPTTLGRRPEMSETPTFGRYAEIPYDEMTPEQQEGYHSLLETRGPLGGPRKIWVHNPKLAKGDWTSRRAFSSRALLVDRART